MRGVAHVSDMIRALFHVASLGLTCLWGLSSASADRLHIAYATNFDPVIEHLAPLFEAETGHELVLSAGSSGSLYAQIRQGAPYDVFLSADMQRPQRLIDDHEALGDHPVIYARGGLVLWSARPDVDIQTELIEGKVRRLALANPDLAPYGRAAHQVLVRLQPDPPSQQRQLTAQNVGQVFAMVATQSAQTGFIARSQWMGLDTTRSGSAWPVPQSLHDPINQGGVVLARSDATDAAADFLMFLIRDDIQAEIQSLGYATHAPGLAE